MAATRSRQVKASFEHEGDGSCDILAAAARAFMVNGYAATSVDTVAEILGCTKGRIYYYFKGKAQLFFGVHRMAMEMNIGVVRPIAESGDPPARRLRRMLEEQLVLIMERLPFQRVLVQGVEMHREGKTSTREREELAKLIDQRDEYEQLFVRVIEEGVRDQEFRAVNPSMFCKMLLGSVTWVTMWYQPRAGELLDRKEELSRELSDYILGGLLANRSG